MARVELKTNNQKERSKNNPGKQTRKTEIFQDRRVFVEQGHFNKYFIYKAWKKGPAEKILEIILLDALKNAF